jgi:hypothetical protein
VSKTLGLFVRTISFVFRSSGGLEAVFPGTPIVESDYSVVNYEKSANRQSLGDLYLEVILQAEQFELAQIFGVCLFGERGALSKVAKETAQGRGGSSVCEL